MKKTAIIFAYIFTIISLIGLVGGTIYLFIYLAALARDLSALSLGSEAPALEFNIWVSIMCLAITVYFVFASITGALTKRVLDADSADKITKFGILSIIFFNPVGGILAIVYNGQLKKELERTAPKGKRKEI